MTPAPPPPADDLPADDPPADDRAALPWRELFSVAGQSVLVTGGSRGIGYMIAEGFLRGGAEVVITARKERACHEAGERLRELGSCTAIPADVSDPRGLAALTEALGSRSDTLNVVVNNAGAAWGAPIEQYPQDAWSKVLSVNVQAVFDVTVAMLPLLRGAVAAGQAGRVINIGSVEGIQVPRMENYAYSSSKAAVHMLTRHLALRLAPDAITVNCLAPGPFDSKMMAFVLDDPAGRAEVAARIPLKRIGRPTDIAGAAVFLASPAASYLTGTIIPVDGGLTAR